MECQDFHRHTTRLTQRLASGHAPRQIWKRDAEIAIVVFVDQRNIGTHIDHLSFKPARFSIERSVPNGKSRSGWGTVTRPGFNRCLN